MTVSNSASPTYLPRPVLDSHGNPILATAGVSWVQKIWTAKKQGWYRPVLGDLVLILFYTAYTMHYLIRIINDNVRWIII